MENGQKQNEDFSRCFWTGLQFKLLAYVCSECLLLKNNLDLNQVKIPVVSEPLRGLIYFFNSEETKILNISQYLYVRIKSDTVEKETAIIF